STAPLLTSSSTISSACSPVSGCDNSNSFTSTPNAAAYTESSACSASTNAATPPALCASATTCNDNVVLPPDSGPYTSTIRPLGAPPTLNLSSSAHARVLFTSIPGTCAGYAPKRWIASLPNWLSFTKAALSRSFFVSWFIAPQHYGRLVPSRWRP